MQTGGEMESVSAGLADEALEGNRRSDGVTRPVIPTQGANEWKKGLGVGFGAGEVLHVETERGKDFGQSQKRMRCGGGLKKECAGLPGCTGGEILENGREIGGQKIE
jgi:hypothetical protein